MELQPTQPSRGVKSGRVRPEEQLARWGLVQHRLVTTEQLHRVGWSDQVIVARVRSGRLHPVFAEVYSLGGPVRTDRERWMASVLTFGSGTRVSDVTAADLHGWVRFPTGELHVTAPTERRPREGIRPHRRTGSTEWGTIDHIPVTGPEQTLLDCAGTVRSDTLFQRIVRQAQAERATTHARLLLLCAGSAGVRGVARLRRELADGPTATRSANEDRVVNLLRNGGPMLTNYVIDGDEVDLYFPEARAVIEIQSELHDNPAARKHDAAKKARLEARGLQVYWMS